MKLFTLLGRLKNFADRNLTGEELSVMIVTKDPSIGPRRMTQLESADLGFDWEKGRVVLTPKEPLYTRTQQEEITRLTKELDRTVLENFQLKRQLKKELDP